MVRRHGLTVPFALAVLAAAASTAVARPEGGGPPGPPAPGPGPAPAEGGTPPPAPAKGGPADTKTPAPAGEGSQPGGAGEAAGAAAEAPPEVKGNRYRIKLKHGAQIEGVLPQGIFWERLDEVGEYVEAKEAEKGAGLRLQHVLNLEGDIFILKRDIQEVKDMGALTEEQVRAIRDQILAQRRKVIEEREKVLREEMARMGASMREKNAEEGAAGEGGAKEPGKKPGKDESEEIKKGEALLAKFPPSDWSEQRMKDVVRREIVNGIFRSPEEAEFITNIEAWKAALARREKAEAEKKEAEKKEEKEGGEGEGEGEKKENEGEAPEGGG